MIIEKSHIVAAPESDGQQRCARCLAVVSKPGERKYVEGTRVGVIIATVSEVSSHYAVKEVFETTPPLCTPCQS